MLICLDKKYTATISIDKNIWELAKDKLPTSRSAFIEHQLKMYLDIEDPEQKVLDKICTTKRELHALEDKLFNIQEAKKLRIESNEVFDECMVPINRLFEKQECIGRNQIRNIAHNYDVPSVELEDYCLSEGLKIVNFMEVPK